MNHPPLWWNLQRAMRVSFTFPTCRPVRCAEPRRDARMPMVCASWSSSQPHSAGQRTKSNRMHTRTMCCAVLRCARCWLRQTVHLVGSVKHHGLAPSRHLQALLARSPAHTHRAARCGAVRCWPFSCQCWLQTLSLWQHDRLHACLQSACVSFIHILVQHACTSWFSFRKPEASGWHHRFHPKLS